MRVIYSEEYNGTRADLERRITAHAARLDAHRFTVGKPAPVEAELVEELARSGDAFTLETEFPWAWRSNGVGEPVTARRVAPYETLAPGESLITTDPTGWIVDNTGAIRAQTSAERLARAKRERQTYINQRREAEIAGGVDFGPWHFDTDPTSVGNLTSAVAFIQAAPGAGLQVPPSISWRDANNVDRDLTPAQLVQLGGAIFAKVQAAHFKARQIKDRIAAATTLAAIAAEDW